MQGTVRAGGHKNPKQPRGLQGWLLPPRVGAELTRVLPWGGLRAQDAALTGPAERRRPAPLGGAKSKSDGARRKVARPSPSGRPPAVEPCARLLSGVQSSSRHSSGGGLLMGSLQSHTCRWAGMAPTKPPFKPFLHVEAGRSCEL